jgi:hypothetical protein
VTVDLTPRYGDAPEHLVDLRLPPGSPDEPRPRQPVAWPTVLMAVEEVTR